MPGFRLEDYETVDERIHKFWSLHPLGRIVTELVHVDDQGGYVVKASVWTDLGEDGPRATGHAEEHMTEGHRVNQTWPLENCETSAVGRALAQLGLSPKGKRPSREEMSKPSGSEPISRGKAPTGVGRPQGPDSSSDAAGSPGTGQGSGEGGASDQGEGSSHRPSPYPFDPTKCTHRFPSGHWLKWDEQDRCPRCGTPKLVAMEGTTADLGPAS